MRESGLTRVLALAAALLASPLAADWLVLEDGKRLETRGPWEERGRLVVFTTTDGTFASMHLSEVDLEASRRATIASAAPPPPVATPPSEPKTAAWVLTDADVAHAREVAGDGETDAATTDAAGPAERLVVMDYQEVPMADEEGTRLTGTLRNVSGDATTRISLTVLVYDADGDLLATANAMLSSQALMPRQQARFQVDFVGLYAIAAVTFRPTTLPIDTGNPEADDEADDETDTDAGLAPEDAFPDGSPSGEPANDSSG